MSRVSGEAGYQDCSVMGPQALSQSSRVEAAKMSKGTKARTGGVRWGELLEEHWVLARVSNPSFLQHQQSLFYMEQKQVEQGVWESRSSAFAHYTRGQVAVRSQSRAQGSAPGRQCSCLLGRFRWRYWWVAPSRGLASDITRVLSLLL